MALEARGVEAAVDFVGGLGRRSRFAAVQAVNRTAKAARTSIARKIRDQVALPAGYLTPGGRRLVVYRRATRARLEAVIRARSRPTSLARFITGAARPGRGQQVTVQVAHGRAVTLRRAFVIPLRQGTALTDTQRNLGLAIRLRPGERIVNKRRQVRHSRGLYLLYGPSVQQVFLDNEGRGVADDVAPATALQVEREYLRLMRL